VVAVIADTESDAPHRRAGFAPMGRLTGVGREHGRRVETVITQRALPAAIV
jgi:L-amino acid N-acyltransferase YncA